MQEKSNNFITWVCPLLKRIVFTQDQYIYYENDNVECIYFLTHGVAGFVLPFRKNIVYVEIDEGDDFGQADITASSIEENTEI